MRSADFILLILMILMDNINSSVQVRPYYPAPKCRTTCSVELLTSNHTVAYDSNPDYGNFSAPAECNFIASTPACSRMAKFYTENSSGLSLASQDDVLHFEKSLPACDGRLVVKIWPFAKRHEDLVPGVNLHIDLEVNDSNVTAVALRQRCVVDSLVAFSKDDILCVNKTRPGSWGGFLWPCRMFDWSASVPQSDKGQRLVFPLKFEHDCFSAGLEFSQFNLDVIQYPKLCRNTYAYMAVQYHQTADKSFKNRAPFVIVDANRAHTVTVFFDLLEYDHFQPHLALVDILNAEKGVKSDVLTTEQISIRNVSSDSHPSAHLHSVQIYNLKRGNYTAVVTLLSDTCSTSDRTSTSALSYRNCPSGRVNFQVSRDLQPFDDSKRLPLSFVLALVLCAAFAASSVSLAYRRRCRRSLPTTSRRPPATLTFDKRPTVYLIYTDDCQEHTDCIVRLAEYLRDYLNCDVLLDEWIFGLPGFDGNNFCSEVEWVLKCATSCDYYLIVFSAGSRAIMNTLHSAKNSTVRQCKQKKVIDEDSGTFRAASTSLASGHSVEESASLANRATPLFGYQNGISDARNNIVKMELIPRRRWLETFNLSLACAYQYALEETSRVPGSKLPKIICCTLNSGNQAGADGDSHLIPNEWKVLPCSKYRLLTDMPSLIRHLHDLPDEFFPDYASLNLGLQKLDDALRKASSYYSLNPNFLSNRLRPIQSTMDRFEIDRLLQQRAIDSLTKKAALQSDDGNSPASDFAEFAAFFNEPKTDSSIGEDFPLINIKQAENCCESGADVDESSDFPLIAVEDDDNAELLNGSADKIDLRRPLMVLDYK